MTTSWRTRLAVMLSLFLLLFLLTGVVQATANDPVQWSAVITVSFTPAQIARPGWSTQAAGLQNALSARVAARGVSFSAKQQTRSDGGVDYVASLSGNQDLNQFKQVMFDDITPLGGMLGGPITLNLTGDVSAGEEVPVVLESNIASGSDWQVKQIDGARSSGSTTPDLASKGMLLGAPMRQTVRLVGAATGQAKVTLIYHRPWENSFTPTRTIALSAARLSMLADLSDPTPVKSAPAASNRSGTTTLRPSTVTLPSAWDWRDHNGTPPVRDQGNCGSCWAFGTVGAFESELMIQGGLTPQDLSEQFLVSCNKEGWGCNGGWWGHDYHLSPTDPQAVRGKNQTDTGGVMESAFPYNPGAVCPLTALPHPFKLSDWAYIVPSKPMSVAPASAIKDAIYNHGPVAAAMCIGSAFQNYRSGVFSTDEKSTCGSNNINHGIVLVGWNDSNNTWILRNSWGTGWGENGYMEIARGVSNVGFAANYVDYPATPGCYSLATGANPGPGGAVHVDTPPNCSNGTQYTAGTTVTLTAAPNTGYVFSGWSGDAIGSTNPLVVDVDGATSVAANFASTAQTVQENDARVQYDSWRLVSDPQANGGAYRVSNIAKSKAKFKFTGTSVKWITRKAPDQGKAKVLIDGVNKGTFDLYSASAVPNAQITFKGLASQTHTLVVKVLGTQNASAADHNVAVDGFVVGGTTRQENASSVQYDTWIRTASTTASGGSYRHSVTSGATVSFTFTGVSISWLMDTCSACGKAEIFIDGVDHGTIDTYSSSALKYSASAPYAPLAAGTHTIQIQVLGAKNAKSSGTKINVDGFQYSTQ
jgi:C1A family cysteine protease